MKSNKFFSVAWDVIFDPKIEILGMLVEGLKVSRKVMAVGLWVSLLSLLYYCDGLVDISEPIRKKWLMNALGLSEPDLTAFLKACESCELIDGDLLEMGHVANHGVCDEIEYRKQKSEAGKKGNDKRWNRKK